MKDSEVIKKTEKIIEKFVNLLGVSCSRKISIEVDEGDKKYIKVIFEGDSLGDLIGYKGRVLNAIQIILSQIISFKLGESINVLVDVNNYRQRRKEYLESLARRAAQEARDNKQSVELPPLSPFERRIIHLCLKDEKGVTTESVGEGEERHVVVKSTKK